MTRDLGGRGMAPATSPRARSSDSTPTGDGTSRRRCRSRPMAAGERPREYSGPAVVESLRVGRGAGGALCGGGAGCLTEGAARTLGMSPV